MFWTVARAGWIVLENVFVLIWVVRLVLTFESFEEIMADSGARLSLAANRGVTGTLFGLALISFAGRMYIRIRQKRFWIEDGLLTFAVVCLIAATGLHYASVKHHYDSLAVILHAEIDLILNLLGSVALVSKESNASSTLWWFVIQPVKLAFLFFFRRLIERVQGLRLWWYFSVIYTIAAGLVCVGVSWTTCPYFEPSKILTCSGPAADARVIRNTSITTAMDISTDFVVISIPIILLWRVQINLRQKIGLGISLCLSLVMVLVAVTRMAGIKLPDSGAVDIVWLAFWQQQECSIAVIMVSVSAFRSLFVARSSSAPQSPPMADISSWKSKLLRKQRYSGPTDSHNSNDLPQIPGATLTGVRTVIQGGCATTVDTAEYETDGVAFSRSVPRKPLPAHVTEKNANVQSYVV